MTIHPDNFKFTRKLLILSGILLIVSLVLMYVPEKKLISNTAPFLVVFFFAGTFIIHQIMMKAAGAKFGKFARTFMLITIGKLFFYLAVIIAYILLFRHDAIPFIITFIIFYFLYTFVEVSSFLSQTRNLNK